MLLRSFASVLGGAALSTSCTLLTDPQLSVDRYSRITTTPATVEPSAFAPVSSDSGIVTRLAIRNTGTGPATAEYSACDLVPAIIERSERVRYPEVACTAILYRLEIPTGATREITSFLPWYVLESQGIRLDGAHAQFGVFVNDQRVLSPRARVR